MNPIIDGQQPSWRLWGEEKTEGAIYTVYLKKVRYHPSTSISCNDSDDSVSHLEWETVKVRVLKAGTLERIVENLCNDAGELEPTYINIFLATYRCFATPQQVLTAILDRYKQLGSNKLDFQESTREQHRQTLVQALHVWLDMFPEDFYEPPQFLTLHQLIDFTQRYIHGNSLQCKAQHKLEKLKKKEGDGLFILDYPSWSSQYCRDSHANLVLPYRFEDIPEDHFASQLTWMDAELFKKLVPHHCLGSMWSRRNKGKNWDSTIRNTATATVHQFNAVSSRVISTILLNPDEKPTYRAQIIAKWIDIAQELRFLKNFSSLKAIIAALQSNAIYRLNRVWLTVPREKVEVFSELARIFSEDNNQITCRELLLKEGSAKFADTVGENDRQLQKAMQRQLSSSTFKLMQGTVPYLGTFLTDLTMMDTAIPDTAGGDLINFDKRRKEFEVLAQIKLLQSATKNYSIPPDMRFMAWFDSVEVLDENESYKLSCMIEPPSVPVGNGVKEKRPILTKSASLAETPGHKKNDSTSSTSSSSTGQFCDQSISDVSMNSLQHDGSIEDRLSQSTSSLSLLYLNNSGGMTPSPSPPQTAAGKGSQQQPAQQADFYIIRVSVEQPDRNEQQGLNVYKSIMLSNRDHTNTVIKNAILKHGIEGDPDNYILAQQLPDGEIVFPPSANVYYAVNTAFDLNFVLRPKKCMDSPMAHRKSKKGSLLKKKILSSTP